MLLLEFKLDKLYLLSVCTKNTQPFQADLLQFFTFHLATMTVFVCGWIYLYISQARAGARTREPQAQTY